MADASRGAWMERPKTVWLAVLLAAGLGVSAVLGSGFELDDYFQLLVIEDRLPVPAAENARDIYSFLDGDPRHIGEAQNTGPLPWWCHPELKIRFWRPVAAELVRIDHALFGREPLGYHLHGVLWYLVSVLFAGFLFRRLLPARAAGLAVLLFAVAACHRQATAWIASRYVLLSFSFGALALLAHLRWRLEGWRPGLALSVPAWILAFLSGEAALGLLAFLFAFEVFAGPGGKRRRSQALLPGLLVGAVWITLYTIQGYGTHGSGAYVNPIQNPGAFLAELPTRFLAMQGCLFLGFQSDFWFGAPQYQSWFVIGGGLALLLVLLLARGLFTAEEAGEAGAFRWLFVGTLLATLPQTAGALGPRSLFVPSFGAAALIALIVIKGFQRLRERGAAGSLGLSGQLRRVAGLLLLTLHLFVALLFWPIWTSGYQGFFSFSQRLVQESPLARDDLADRRVVIVAQPNLQLAAFEPFRRVLYGQPLPKTWWTLSIAQGRHRLTRTGANVLVLEPLETRLLQSPLESILRSPDAPLDTGDKIFLEGVRVEILASTGGQPSKIAFSFDPPLDDPSYLFLDGNLGPLTLPAIGSSQVVEQGGFPGP